MREIWTLNTTSERLLFLMEVVIDNMFILFLSIDNIECLKIDAKLANKIYNRIILSSYILLRYLRYDNFVTQ